MVPQEKRLWFEHLEDRMLMSISLGNDFIVTDFDTVPRLCGPAYATHHTVKDGAWSNPSTWDHGVPGDGANVSVTNAVTYDLALDAELNCIEVGAGSLTFSPTDNARMRVTTLYVLPGGMLRIKPTTGSSEIIINDAPLDLVRDPDQYGNGLLVFGTVDIAGAEKTDWLRLAASPRAGSSTLALSSIPSGWKVGDRLGVPDTRQGQYADSQSETAVVSAISGQTITITVPLAYDHFAAKNANGFEEFFPHVVNLTRNVVIRSENPAGVRGHDIFFDRANVNVRYAAFLDLGRTTVEKFDNTLNHIGRYPLHTHHLNGPETPTGTYQFQLVGNVITSSEGNAAGGRRWGIAVHSSHFGLIKDNVVFRGADGAGIVTEDASEYGNTFEHNAVMAVAGGGTKDGASDATSPGAAGDGFWFHGPLNKAIDNVSADVARIGMAIFAAPTPGVKATNVRIPTAPGQDESAWITVPLVWQPISEFARNEVYAASNGFPIWRTRVGDIVPTLKDVVLWHIAVSGINAYLGPGPIVLDGWTQLNDPAKIGRVRHSAGFNTSIIFAGGQTNELYVRRARIENCRFGVWSRGRNEARILDVRDSTLRNGANLEVATFNNRVQITVGNTQFGDPFGMTAIDVSMNWALMDADPFLHMSVTLSNFNGTGNDYDVYFAEQAPDFVIPESTLIPDKYWGKTNAEIWASDGVAIAGEIARCTTIDPRVRDGFWCER